MQGVPTRAPTGSGSAGVGVLHGSFSVPERRAGRNGADGHVLRLLDGPDFRPPFSKGRPSSRSSPCPWAAGVQVSPPPCSLRSSAFFRTNWPAGGEGPRVGDEFAERLKDSGPRCTGVGAKTSLNGSLSHPPPSAVRGGDVWRGRASARALHPPPPVTAEAPSRKGLFCKPTFCSLKKINSNCVSGRKCLFVTDGLLRSLILYMA